MRKHLSNIFLFLILIIGLSLLLYPTFADWWNSFHQSRAIASYTEQVASMDEDEYAEIWDAAIAYNQSRGVQDISLIPSEEQMLEYNQLLNVGGNGVMGYIEIPAIDVSLPIYHGTDEAVLQIAVGHLDWTSLPVGGPSTHCVLSGHRGLPSAKLFTDLDRLVVGDVFVMRILNEVLTYQVDQILIVEPHETQDLMIVEGMDYCTLVTCTPYGINSHRMLVRGHRVENEKEALNVHVTADAIRIEPVIVAPILATPLLLLLIIAVIFRPRKKRKKRPSKGGGL